MYLELLSIPKCLKLESHRVIFREWLLNCKIVSIPTIENDRCIGSLVLETDNPHSYVYTISSAMIILNEDKQFGIVIKDINPDDPKLSIKLRIILTTRLAKYSSPVHLECDIVNCAYIHGRTLIPFVKFLQNNY